MHLVISKAINVTTLKNPAKKVIHSGRHWDVLNRHLDDHDARKELERLTIMVMAILRGVMANSPATDGTSLIRIAVFCKSGNNAPCEPIKLHGKRWLLGSPSAASLYVSNASAASPQRILNMLLSIEG